MDYGKLAIDLLQRGLSRDEQAIAIASAGGRVVEPKTIGVYDEYWLQYLLFKEALACDGCPTVRHEGNRVDIRFIDGDTVLAEFELKGAFRLKSRPLGTTKLNDIITDFETQCAACSILPTAAHYLLLAVTADPSEARQWVYAVLLPQLHERQPQTCLVAIAGEPIPLNPAKGIESALTLFAISITAEPPASQPN